MSIAVTTNKKEWPEDLKGYSIGKDGYLAVSFDEGKTYHEIDTAKDVTLSFSTTTVDTSCRRSGMYRENLPIINELTIDAEMLFDLRDETVRKLIKRSQENGIFLIGAFTDSGNGPLFYGCATDMSRPEELEGVVRLSAKYSLTRFINWFEGSTKTSAKDFYEELQGQAVVYNGTTYKHPRLILKPDLPQSDPSSEEEETP